MPAPTNTYNSPTNLSLGQVPQVDDPEVYRALLDIHNALETLLTGSDANSTILLEFLNKFRRITEVTASYLVNKLDGTVLVDASLGAVVITMPPVADILGWRFDIKKLPNGAALAVTLVGAGVELIDGRVGGILISSGSSYTIKATETGWVII
jgi:hypothetical protein